MRDKLISTYLDFINNYLTIELFAEHNLLTVDQAKQLIALSKAVFETDIEEVL
jgi:hypothetical protein